MSILFTCKRLIKTSQRLQASLVLLLILVLLMLPITYKNFLFQAIAKNSPTSQDRKSVLKSNDVHQAHGGMPAEHILVASYYSFKRGLTSKLTLNNKGPGTIEVGLSLFNLQGQRFNLQSISVWARTAIEVNLNQAAVNAPTSFEEGSLQLRYDGKHMELGAHLLVASESKSVVFSEHLVEDGGHKSAGCCGTRANREHLEGTFFIPFPTTIASLVLTNSGGAPIYLQALIKISQDHEFKMVLQPYETRIVSIPQSLYSEEGGTAGGVSIRTSSGSQLIARLLLEEPARGFSLATDIEDPRTGKSQRLDGAGLRLGQVNGQPLTHIIVARNVGAQFQRVRAKVRFFTFNNNEVLVNLPSISLGPGEAKAFSTATASLGKQDAKVAGLEIDFPGEPGSVIASAYSMTSDGFQVFPIPVIDAQAQMSATGSYPWTISQTSSPLVFIKNTTNEVQEFYWEIKVEDVAYAARPVKLGPGETKVIDIKRLRDEQVPDAFGAKISQGASNGTLRWSRRGQGNHGIIGRIEQADVNNGLVSGFHQCGFCCQDSVNAARIDDGIAPMWIDYDDSANATAYVQYLDCYGNPTSWYETNAAWSTYNSNIVSLDSSYASVNLISGIMAGEAQVNARVAGYHYNGVSCSATACEYGAMLIVYSQPKIQATNSMWYFNGVHPSDTSNYPTFRLLNAQDGRPSGTARTWTVTQGSSVANFGGYSQLNNETYNPITINSADRSLASNDVSVTVTVGNATSRPFLLTVKAPHTTASLPSRLNS